SLVSYARQRPPSCVCGATSNLRASAQQYRANTRRRARQDVGERIYLDCCSRRMQDHQTQPRANKLVIEARLELDRLHRLMKESAVLLQLSRETIRESRIMLKLIEPHNAEPH